MPWFDPSWYGRRWRPAPARRWRPGGASTRAVACPVATPAVFPTPPSSCGTPADRRPTPSAPDTVLRSWEREWWSHKPSSVCAPRRASRWSSLWDGRHRPPQAAYPQLERPGPGLAAYLALLRLGVAVPRPLPNARWALTPPFHPYPWIKGGLFSVALSVALRRPGVTWQSALRSSDFPQCASPAGAPRPSRPTATRYQSYRHRKGGGKPQRTSRRSRHATLSPGSRGSSGPPPPPPLRPTHPPPPSRGILRSRQRMLPGVHQTETGRTPCEHLTAFLDLYIVS